MPRCPAVCTLQVRRKMEDENRKARRIARREYLENVRELVAFVKKRDKRVAKAQVRPWVDGGLCAATSLDSLVNASGTDGMCVGDVGHGGNLGAPVRQICVILLQLSTQLPRLWRNT